MFRIDGKVTGVIVQTSQRRAKKILAGVGGFLCLV